MDVTDLIVSELRRIPNEGILTANNKQTILIYPVRYYSLIHDGILYIFPSRRPPDTVDYCIEFNIYKCIDLEENYLRLNIDKIATVHCIQCQKPRYQKKLWRLRTIAIHKYNRDKK